MSRRRPALPPARRMAAPCRSPPSSLPSPPAQPATSGPSGTRQTSTAAAPAHTYNAFGLYDVSLRVTSAQGCTDQVLLQDYIRVEAPQAQLNISEREGCLPHTTSFSALLTTTGSIASYHWDFGDGTTSSLPTPSHAYTQQGIHPVILTLETSGGCRLVLTSSVQAGEIPVVDFDGTPKAPCADRPVHFTNLSVPRGTEWRWTFPEATTARKLRRIPIIFSAVSACTTLPWK